MSMEPEGRAQEGRVQEGRTQGGRAQDGRAHCTGRRILHDLARKRS